MRVLGNKLTSWTKRTPAAEPATPADADPLAEDSEAENRTSTPLKRTSTGALVDRSSAAGDRDTDHDDLCDAGDRTSTAASTLLMLQEETPTPTPFFQFPRVAPPVLANDPAPKRSCNDPSLKRSSCFQFGQNAPSVLVAWPQGCGDVRSPSPCHSPRSRRTSQGAINAELKETVNKMLQTRLSSSSHIGDSPSGRSSATSLRNTAACA